MRKDRKPDLEKFCEMCGAPMPRKMYGKTLESYSNYLRRRRCSQSCANRRTEVVKDTLHWRARQHVKTNCEECGTTERLHVHHKDRNPANNDPGNLATLCASCHLKLHWREDGPTRARKRNGASTSQQSGSGKRSSAA